jgi:hypothetical protein
VDERLLQDGAEPLDWEVTSPGAEAMKSKTLRKVQPAHRSDRITVSQAKDAWLRTATPGKSPHPPGPRPGGTRSPSPSGASRPNKP